MVKMPNVEKVSANTADVANMANSKISVSLAADLGLFGKFAFSGEVGGSCVALSGSYDGEVNVAALASAFIDVITSLVSTTWGNFIQDFVADWLGTLSFNFPSVSLEYEIGSGCSARRQLAPSLRPFWFLRRRI